MIITRRTFLKLFGSSFAAIAALLSYGTGAEAMGSPRVQRYAFRPQRWTDGLKLKVVVVADIHGSDPWMDAHRIGNICQQANDLGGDIILLLGDYVNAIKRLGLTIPGPETADILKSLHAPLGVHAVLGNHDYWQNNNFENDPKLMPDIGRALQAAGIPVLVNEAVRLEKDGKPFWVAGLGDQIGLNYSKLNGPVHDAGLDDLPATMAKVTDDAPMILMAHEPDIFPQVTDRVAVTLSGHTHGGQVNIFGWSPAMNSRYGNRYRGGHVVEEGRHIVISRGLGCTGIPFRLGVWPEIVVLDLG